MPAQPGINFVIPMAGRGARFAAAGYKVPKYMIEAGGRSLFEHSLASLPLALGARAVFIALREHERFGLSAFISEKFAAVAARAGAQCAHSVVYIDGVTRGQAETVLAARPLLDPDGQLAIFNIDTGFVSPTLAPLLAGEGRRDGVIGAFRLGRREDKWSFALPGPDGAVLRTAEKEQISDFALTGFYHFTRARDYFDAADAAIASGGTVRGEYYVAPLYNPLIAKGRRFALDVAERIIPLGTPEDVARYAG